MVHQIDREYPELVHDALRIATVFNSRDGVAQGIYEVELRTNGREWIVVVIRYTDEEERRSNAEWISPMYFDNLSDARRCVATDYHRKLLGLPSSGPRPAGGRYDLFGRE